MFVKQSSSQPDEDILPNDQVLIEYKGQQSSERGFHFLEDPLFFTSSVFLNTPRRVAALAMVMGLCLLVYTLGQRQLRQALAHAEETIPNQLKKRFSALGGSDAAQPFLDLKRQFFNFT